jgi:hypothetical protein
LIFRDRFIEKPASSRRCDRFERKARPCPAIACLSSKPPPPPPPPRPELGNQPSVLLNNGEGSFDVRRDYATGKGPDAVAAGDLNGDGKPDLVTRNKGSVSVLFNRGDGSFEGKRDYPAGGGGSFSPAIVDVSGDDKPDLASTRTLP